MEHIYARISVEEEVASDINFFMIDEKRLDVMLDKTILLQITIFCLCSSFFFVGRIQLRSVENHIIQCKLSQIELFRLYKLLLELVDITNESNSSALIEVSRFVDADSRRIIIYKFNLIRHNIKSLSLG
jgi:hypothetical protein